MSISILTALNLNKNEIQNLRIQNLSSEPSTPVEGQIYQNTTDHKMYRYNGTAWIALLPGTGDVVGPASAVDSNFAAFDTTTGKLIKDSGKKATDFDSAGAAATVAGNLSTHAGLTDTAHGGLVSSVSGTAPVTSSGGSTPAISMAAATASVNGYMTSTYASKLDGIAAGATANTGDVVGPASATDHNLPQFAGATGKIIEDSGVTIANVSSAVSLKHTQGTDTGTTATAFQLDSGNTGPKLKNNAGVIELRNAADNAYADLKVKDLTVSGTTTTINSETLTIDDNTVVLNNNVTGTPSENGGLEIERGTSTNATLLWDESNDQWVAGVVGATARVARVVAASVGTGAATSIDVTHNLGTVDVIVQVHDNSTPYAQVLCDVEHKDTNTVTVKFAAAPTSNQYRVVVTG